MASQDTWLSFLGASTAPGWDQLTPEQRIAHSLYFGTPYAQTYATNNNVNTDGFTFGGLPTKHDQIYQAGQSMFNDLQNYQAPAQQETTASEPKPWEQYGFRSEAAWNQYANNMTDKFGLDGSINRDWFNSLSDKDARQYWYDQTSGGWGTGSNLESQWRDALHQAYLDRVGANAGQPTDGFTFGGLPGSSGGATSNAVSQQYDASNNTQTSSTGGLGASEGNPQARSYFYEQYKKAKENATSDSLVMSVLRGDD